MNNYLRNPRFNHQSEQASESALVSRNTNETEKRLGGAGEPPILLDLRSENALSAEMLSLYESLLPTEESHKKRKEFANKIEKILNDEWPGKDIKVHMFGSSMNELGTTQSDVDLCVTTQWPGLKNIFTLSNCLNKQHGMRIEQTVHKAKVPIVRLFDSKLELACDINVNNTLALHNTRLIRNYVNIDPRVRPLAMVVKHWARRRVLNDAAKGGTISTYTWTCIILNFLQMRDPPILPVLHNIPHEGVDPIVVNGEDASFYEDVESLRQFGSSNKESLGGLLFAFFRRMAFEFDYDNHVISLRQGKYLTKAEKGWDTCKGWKMLCVEEPFNTARNLGNSADDVSVNGLREEFRRAYDILYETASLEKLCEEYHFPDPYNNYNNLYYYPNRYYNNNNKRVQHKRNNNNNNKTNGTWNVNKPGNRKQCIKSNQQNGQNNYLNNSTDNFYDVNGKSNYSQDHQDAEEDGSSMRRFDNNIPSLRQNGHYEESTVAPVSEYNTYSKRYYDNNDGSIRKQFDSIQNQNRRQIQYHNVSKDDEQLRPQIRKNYIKKKSDDQFNNYSQSQNEHEGFTTRYFDTTSNQNQLVYKNNNQKADNIPYNKNARQSRFPYSDQKSSYSQNTNISYDSDNNKYNSNSCLRLPNTHSDLDQKSFVAYNTNDQERRTYYNKPYSNKREPIIDDSSSNSNFDRSNLAQIPNSKSGNKSNKNRNFKQTRQYQKSAENTDFTNLPYYNYNVGDNNSIPLPSLMVTVSIQSDLPQQFYQPRQSNDGPVNYQRRLSHQSSSDGSNSQTSGNTSNTSYTNNSSASKNSYQKNNSNQNNYYQQQNQPNQQNQNKPNINRKKKNNNNNMNGSGNGNFRLNSTANSSPSVIALNYNDPNYQDVHTQSQINQGQGHYGNEYNGNNDTNGYKIYNGSNSSYNSNYKNYNNNNNSNGWRNSNGNGNHTKTLNGSRNNNNNNTNNGSKSVNNGNNFSSQSVNGSYSRSNFNNNNNNSYLRNQNNYNVNSNKSVNGNNLKSLDGNNSNLQTKNFNNNNYSGQGQIKNGQTYNSKKSRNKNTRNTTKVENKEDCVNHQQQYPQEERQSYHNIQSHQQKKVGQNGQNNNSGKGKGFKKNSYLKQNAEYLQQQ